MNFDVELDKYGRIIPKGSGNVAELAAKLPISRIEIENGACDNPSCPDSENAGPCHNGSCPGSMNSFGCDNGQCKSGIILPPPGPGN